MPILSTLFGAALLVWGRKLFWLFIAAAGFLTGWQIAEHVINGPEWLGFILGILFAIGGALVAMFLKTIAIGIAGFLMGGSVLLSLAGLIGFDQGILAWIVYLVGGIGGAIIIGMFFDWAVIILSSLGGAMLIVNAFSMEGLPRFILLVGLFVLGLIIQASQMRSNRKKQ
jgi:hypothetical protein